VRPPRSPLLALCALAACHRASPLEVVSPSDGVTVRAPWVPLLVRLPELVADDAVSVTIDGADATDPLGLVRARDSQRGGGVDYLATLDTTELDPGFHDLEVAVEGVPPVRTRFEVAHPESRVDFEVTDGDGEPVPARILLRDADGPVELASPDAEDADPSLRDVHLSSLFAEAGHATVWLDPGTYTVVAVRGPRDALDVREIEVLGDTTVALTVPRVLDTPGLLAADLHVHTGRSADAFVPDHPRFASLLAAGLDAFVITDHNRVSDPTAALSRVQGALGPVSAIPGEEAAIIAPNHAGDGRVACGHVNAFPLAGPDAAPLPDGNVDDAEGIAALIDTFRARQADAPYRGSTDVLLQLNHPRGIQFFPDQAPDWGAHALFTHFGLVAHGSPGTGDDAWIGEAAPSGTTPLDFDAMEILNRFSWETYLQVRQDWFWLLNQGIRLTGTGNSDSHSLEVELAGFPTNLVATDLPAEGEGLDTAAFVAAIRASRVSVTTGPVVSIVVRAGAGSGESGQLVPGDGGAWDVVVRVRAADWVPVDQLRLVVNGEQVYGEDLADAPRDAAGLLDIERTIPIHATADAWVLAEAGWGLGEDPPVADGYERLGPYAWVAPGYVPIGFTNPVYLDFDGDGVWTPPGD
jgi:hypothetical protein